MRQIKWLFLSLWAAKQDVLSLCVWEFVGWIAYHFRNYPEVNYLTYSSVIALAYIALFFIQKRDKAFHYIPFLGPNDRREWLGNGVFEYIPGVDAFQITKSYNGFIYSKTLLWTNYRVNFYFRIENKSIGVIIRALNLSNYLMFQVFEDKVRIHIRVNSVWYWPPDVDFSSSLALRTWYKLEMQCRSRKIVVKIFDSAQEVFSMLWDIPEGLVPFDVVMDGQKTGKLNFPIELDYGAIGFRNHDDESALVRDLFIQKIH